MNNTEYEKYLFEMGFKKTQKDNQVGQVYRLFFGDFEVQTTEHYPYTWIYYSPNLYSVQINAIPTRLIINEVSKMRKITDLITYKNNNKL